jgi:hypothetical protein
MDRKQTIEGLTNYLNDVVRRHAPKSDIIFINISNTMNDHMSILIGSEYLCSCSLEYVTRAIDFSREESVLAYIYDLIAAYCLVHIADGKDIHSERHDMGVN